MNNNTVEMTLITSSKTGILASIMMTSVKFGLMLSSNKSVPISSNSCRLHLLFNGTLNCSESKFRHEVESFDFVHSVDNLFTNYSGQDSSNAKNSSDQAVTSLTKSNTILRSHDIITKESLRIAEEHLMQTLGPVAPILIASATKETKHIGDLYLLLSKSLEGEEKESFLSLATGLDLNSL